MSGRVIQRVYNAPAGAGFQMGGGEAPAPKPAAPRVRRPQAPAVRRTFGTRTESYDKAAEVLRRLKSPMTDLMRQARIGQAIDEQLVAPVVAQVADSIETHPCALITLARIKAADERAYLHAVTVCALMINFGRQLDLDSGTQRDLGVAGLLHDIGETTLPPTFLERTGRFGPEELELVRTHTARGHEQLARTPGLPAIALDVCLNHHERPDGTGYPGRYPDPQISLEAKMAAICDVYDAVTSDRPYSEAWSPTESLSEMFSWSGQFDQSLLAHFIRSVGVFPTGSLVRLESDHLGVVLEQNGTDLTKPVVRIFYSILDRARIPHRDVDLSTDSGDAIAGREEPRKWGFLDWNYQWPALIRAA